MFAENFNLKSRPFHLGRYSCATSSYQFSALTLNCILLFPLLLLVNVATFLAVLWLFQFDVCSYCPLLRHIYHLLLARCLIHILSHSLPLNLQTGIIQHFLLILENNLALFQFHVVPGSDLVLVEFQITCSHTFIRISNCWSHYFWCRWYHFLLLIRHRQKFLHHNPLLQSRHNWILHYLLYFLYLTPAACCPWLQVGALVWLYLVWSVFWSSFDVYNLVGM